MPTDEEEYSFPKIERQVQGQNDIDDLLNDSDDEIEGRIEIGTRRKRTMSIPAEMQLPEGSTKYTRRGRGVKKPGETFQEFLAYLVNLLLLKDKHKWFSVPIDDKYAPGYSTKVKEPMDFTTMENNLDIQVYKSLEQLKYDFDLICKNALAFNKPGDRVYKAARKLESYGREMLSKKNLRIIVKARPAYSGLTALELGFDVEDNTDEEEEVGLYFFDDSRSQSDSATESGHSHVEEAEENKKVAEERNPLKTNPGNKDAIQVAVKPKRGRKRKETPAKLGENSKTKSESKHDENKMPDTINVLKETPTLLIPEKEDHKLCHVTKIPLDAIDLFSANFPSEKSKDEIIENSANIAEIVSETYGDDDYVSGACSEETYIHKKFGNKNYQSPIKAVKM